MQTCKRLAEAPSLGAASAAKTEVESQIEEATRRRGGSIGSQRRRRRRGRRKKLEAERDASPRFSRSFAPPEAGHDVIKRKYSATPASSGIGIQWLLLKLLPVVVGSAIATTRIEGSTLADFDGATFYKAPLGSSVRIACNGSHWSDDSVSLVLWFKGSQSVPIYTVDARQKSLNSGARHLVADAYKGRAKFVAGKSWPPYLDLSPLEAGDQAEYRCRIDYRSKPRENFLIILFVLVPPKSVQIMDSSGRSLEQIYGPLSEGSDLTLLCLSKGGRPAPSVTWKRKAKVIDDSYLTRNDFLALKQSGQLLAGASSGQQQQQQQRHSSGPANKSDNNQRQLLLMNPINKDPSLADGAASKLAQLWREWASWPEFDYFGASLDAGELKSGSGAGNGSSAADSSTSFESLGGRAEQALHETATTSVNVLRLTNLMSDWLEDERAAPGARRGAPVAQLECEASNLHYDLRTLIRLFAPPSLQQQHPAPGEAPRLNVANNDNNGLRQHQLEAASYNYNISASQASPDRRQQTGITSGALKMDSLYTQLSRAHQLSGQRALEPPEAAEAAEAEVAAPASPLVRSKLIALDLYTRPMDVRISSAQRAHSAGQLAEFSCQSSGSHPPASLSWLKNGRKLDASLWRQLDDPSGNSSQSKLMIELQQEDHGARLACRAENERLTGLLQQQQQQQLQLTGRGEQLSGSESKQPKPEPLEDSQTLTVHYQPKVRLELGRSILTSSIREGSDIYFDCQVEAVPPIKELAWLHNQLPLQASESSGLIMSNNSLVLQRVKVEQRGQYACIASNSEGLTESNKIELRVLHAPVCVGAGSGEEPLVASRSVPLGSRVQLTCQMEADPPELEPFGWYLNSSQSERRPLVSVEPDPRGPNEQNGEQSRQPRLAAAETGQTGSGKRNGTTSSSQLTYLVESELDYGKVYCVARNSIGEQKRACVYEIRQADTGSSRTSNELAADSPPISCLAVNVSSQSAWIGCRSAPQQQQHQHHQHHNQQQTFKYSVDLYSLPSTSLAQSSSEQEQQDQLEELWRSALARGQLEARLTSGQLEEPLFALVNLRPETSYALQLRDSAQQVSGGGQQQASALLRFSTLPAASAGERGAAGQSAPRLEPLSAPLSALISTRSTLDQIEQLAANSWRQQEPQQRLAKERPQSRSHSKEGFLGDLLAAAASLFSPTFAPSAPDADNSAPHRRLNFSGGGSRIWRPTAAANNQLMEPSGAILLLAALLLLLLLGSLVALLLAPLMRRLLPAASGKRRPTGEPASEKSARLEDLQAASSRYGSPSSSADESDPLHRLRSQLPLPARSSAASGCEPRAAPQTNPAPPNQSIAQTKSTASSASTTTTTSSSGAAAVANMGDYYATGSGSTMQRRRPSGSLLDWGALERDGQAPLATSDAIATGSSNGLLGEGDSLGPTSVTKSRSSLCLELLGFSGIQQQQQQRALGGCWPRFSQQIHSQQAHPLNQTRSDRSRRLISDANSPTTLNGARSEHSWQPYLAAAATSCSATNSPLPHLSQQLELLPVLDADGTGHLIETNCHYGGSLRPQSTRRARLAGATQLPAAALAHLNGAREMALYSATLAGSSLIGSSQALSATMEPSSGGCGALKSRTINTNHMNSCDFGDFGGARRFAIMKETTAPATTGSSSVALNRASDGCKRPQRLQLLHLAPDAAAETTTTLDGDEQLQTNGGAHSQMLHPQFASATNSSFLYHESAPTMLGADSLDSNCTWQPASGMLEDANNGFGQPEDALVVGDERQQQRGQQMHFIELLPQSELNQQLQQLIQAANEQQQHNNSLAQNHFLSRTQNQPLRAHLCASLTSSSLGSSSLTKDTLAASSPLSLTNTTLSNADSHSPANYNNNNLSATNRQLQLQLQAELNEQLSYESATGSARSSTNNNHNNNNANKQPLLSPVNNNLNETTNCNLSTANFQCPPTQTNSIAGLILDLPDGQQFQPQAQRPKLQPLTSILKNSNPKFTTQQQQQTDSMMQIGGKRYDQQQRDNVCLCNGITKESAQKPTNMTNEECL